MEGCMRDGHILRVSGFKPPLKESVPERLRIHKNTLKINGEPQNRNLPHKFVWPYPCIQGCALIQNYL